MNKVISFMDNLQKKNPNANWGNLVTGVALLIMITVFSYTFFSQQSEITTVLDESAVVPLNKELDPANIELENLPKVDTTETTQSLTAEEDEVSGTTIVKKGEGLWHVAQRVCGNGEAYNMLARANGLNAWEDLNEGMTLKIVCK